MKQISDNNQQKFDLLKAASSTSQSAASETQDLKNDVQTIKQLLLTRQAATTAVAASGVVEKDKGEDDSSTASNNALNLSSSIGTPVANPSLSLSASTGGQKPKPWEQRRRNRLADSSPGGSPAQVDLSASSPAAIMEEVSPEKDASSPPQEETLEQ